MGSESQKSISIDELAKQNPEAGNSLASGIDFKDFSREVLNNQAWIQPITFLKTVDYKLDEDKLLAFRDDKGDKTTPSQPSNQDILDQLDKAIANDDNTYRKPPVIAPPPQETTPYQPNPNTNGARVETPIRPPEKPRVAGAEVEKARKALPDHYTAADTKQALAAKQKAKELGVPLVVYIGVDEGCQPCQTAKTALSKLEGGQINGATVNGEKHGQAVFLHISAGDNLGDREGNKSAGAIAQSLGIQFGGNDGGGRRPFRRPNSNSVPHIAIFDATSNKVYDKAGLPGGGQQTVAAALKAQIPAPLPASTPGLKRVTS